jgi:hypothetical protein
MASNETIKNLSTLLGALRDFNQPQRELDAYAKKRLIDMNIESELAEIRKAEQQAEIDKMLTKKGLALGQDILAQQALGEAPTAYEAMSDADKKRSKDLGQVVGIAPLVQVRKAMKRSGKDLENVVKDLSSSVINVHGQAVNQYYSGTAGKSPETVKEFTMYKQYLDTLDYDRLSGDGKYKYDSLYKYMNEYIEE